MCSPPASLRYTFPVLATSKFVPSKVKLASPAKAFDPVTVTIVLSVEPERETGPLGPVGPVGPVEPVEPVSPLLVK